MTTDLVSDFIRGSGSIFLLFELLSYLHLPSIILKDVLRDIDCERYNIVLMLCILSRFTPNWSNLLLFLLFFWQVDSEQRSIFFVLDFSVASSYSHELAVVFKLASLVFWDVFFDLFHEIDVLFLSIFNRISDLIGFNFTHFGKFIESFLSDRDHIFKNVP